MMTHDDKKTKLSTPKATHVVGIVYENTFNMLNYDVQPTSDHE